MDTEAQDPERRLTHLDQRGQVHMVDVGDKPATRRIAVADGWIHTRPDVVELVVDQGAAKGDVLAVARVAGIQAAKRTPEWIPLAHPVPLTRVSVEIEPEPMHGKIHVLARTETTAPTGVEMEAMTAVAAALLTLYDMLKAVDRAMSIGPVRLLEKSGGRSGHFVRPTADRGDEA